MGHDAKKVQEEGGGSISSGSAILSALIEAKTALGLRQLSRAVGITVQLTDYHLKKTLIPSGLVLKVYEDGKAKYLAQPVFVNEVFFDATMEMTRMIYRYVKKHGCWRDSRDEKKSVKDCMRLLIDMLDN